MLNLNHIFTIKSNLILLPYWVMDLIKKHRLREADVLNYAKVQPVLSMSDLASVQALQSFGEEVIGARDIITGSILYEWFSSASEAQKGPLDSTIEPLAKDSSFIASLRSRFELDPSMAQREVPFEVIALEDRALAVVMYPGFFAADRYDQQFQIVRALAKQLYVYEQPTVVAETPLFRRYLELLSLRKP
jgi:hypothetical protein